MITTLLSGFEIRPTFSINSFLLSFNIFCIYLVNSNGSRRESGTLGKVRVSWFFSDYGNRRCEFQFSQRPPIVDRLSSSLEVSINRLRACVSEHIFVAIFWPVSGQWVCTSLGQLFDLWVLYVPCLQRVRIKLYLFGVLWLGPWTLGIVSHTSLIDSPVTHLSFFPISCETDEYMIFGWISAIGLFIWIFIWA